MNRNPSQFSEPEKNTKYCSVSNQNEEEIYLRCKDSSRMNRDPFSSYDLSSHDGNVERNRDYEPTVKNQRDDRFRKINQRDNRIKIKQLDNPEMLTDPFVEIVYDRFVVEKPRSPSNVSPERMRCFVGDQLNDYGQVYDCRRSENYFESPNNQDRSKNFIDARGYEKDEKNTYRGNDKLAMHITSFERQVSSTGSRNDFSFRLDDYNQSRTHAGSDNFRNIKEDDYDQLRGIDNKISNLSREEKSRSYSSAGNNQNSDGIDVYKRSDRNAGNWVSPIQDKIRYSEHCNALVADHYKISYNNSFPHHSDVISRRENVEKYPNFNDQLNKNAQYQNKLNLMKSGNVASKNVYELSNCSHETTKQICIQPTNSGKISDNNKCGERVLSALLPANAHSIVRLNIQTEGDKNIKRMPNLNKDHLNEFDIPKYSNEVRSADLQPTNGTISSSNKSVEKVFSSSEQVSSQSNVTLSIKTEEDKYFENITSVKRDQLRNEFDKNSLDKNISFDKTLNKNVSMNTLGLGLDIEQKQPTIQSTVRINEAPLPVADYSSDDNSDNSDDDLKEGEDFIKLSRNLPEKLEKYSSLIERYFINGPCGKLVVTAAWNENAEETFGRLKAMMRRKLTLKKIFDRHLGQWIYRAIMCKRELANITGCKRSETKNAASCLALKTLQGHYYTLLMRNEYFAPVNQVVHVSGKFGPPVSRKSVSKTTRFSEKVNFKETLKRINEFIRSDVVRDLVFSFRFPPNVRQKLRSYARNRGLIARNLGTKRFKFLVMSKYEDLWKIIEGLTNNDYRYTCNFKLVPPGRYDLMYF